MFSSLRFIFFQSLAYEQCSYALKFVLVMQMKLKKLKKYKIKLSCIHHTKNYDNYICTNRWVVCACNIHSSNIQIHCHQASNERVYMCMTLLSWNMMLFKSNREQAFVYLLQSQTNLAASEMCRCFTCLCFILRIALRTVAKSILVHTISWLIQDVVNHHFWATCSFLHLRLFFLFDWNGCVFHCVLSWNSTEKTDSSISSKYW